MRGPRPKRKRRSSAPTPCRNNALVFGASNVPEDENAKSETQCIVVGLPANPFRWALCHRSAVLGLFREFPRAQRPFASACPHAFLRPGFSAGDARHRSRSSRRHSRKRLLSRQSEPFRALPADILLGSPGLLSGAWRWRELRRTTDLAHLWPRYPHRPATLVLRQSPRLGGGLDLLSPYWWPARSSGRSGA